MVDQVNSDQVVLPMLFCSLFSALYNSPDVKNNNLELDFDSLWLCTEVILD